MLETFGQFLENRLQRTTAAGGKVFLVRAIVDDAVSPAVVVTVYRTAKISKYWRKT